MSTLKSITIGQCSLMNCQIVQFKSISTSLLILLSNSLDLPKLKSIDLGNHAICYDSNHSLCFSGGYPAKFNCTLTMHGKYFSTYYSDHYIECFHDDVIA